ncbi:hypothetical protein [Aeromicrobium sp. UC242_57]|uniref:hypothetical protein n=1 Tax=Aeromicrobium sp. UC242_57 TaxID=3374624 RepID=UPI0037B86897
MKILKHRSVQVAIGGLGVIAAGLYLTSGTPIAWAVAAVWAALVAVAITQAARS